MTRRNQNERYPSDPVGRHYINFCASYAEGGMMDSAEKVREIATSVPMSVAAHASLITASKEIESLRSQVNAAITEVGKIGRLLNLTRFESTNSRQSADDQEE